MAISHVRVGVCTHSPEHACVSFLRTTEFPFGNSRSDWWGLTLSLEARAECMMVNVLERRARNSPLQSLASPPVAFLHWHHVTSLRSRRFLKYPSFTNRHLYSRWSRLPAHHSSPDGWRWERLSDSRCLLCSAWLSSPRLQEWPEASAEATEASPGAPMHPGDHNGQETRWFALLETHIWVCMFKCLCELALNLIYH